MKSEAISMPMYKYRCAACGQQFEELLSIAAKDTATCPSCGAVAQREWMGKCAYQGKHASSAQDNCDGCAACPFCRE